MRREEIKKSLLFSFLLFLNISKLQKGCKNSTINTHKLHFTRFPIVDILPVWYFSLSLFLSLRHLTSQYFGIYLLIASLVHFSTYLKYNYHSQEILNLWYYYLINNLYTYFSSLNKCFIAYFARRTSILGFWYEARALTHCYKCRIESHSLAWK